jgi:chromatin assembly factor 1 subunit A
MLTRRVETLNHHSGIDPFSTEYWEPVKPAPAASTLAPPNGTSAKSDSKVMPPPTVADAFKALAAGVPPKKTSVLQADMIEKLKKMVTEKRGLSRVGIVELFNLENKKATKTAIKNTLEMITEKSGKDLVLKAGV